MQLAAERRTITTGPRQGAYDPDYTAYLIEPIDSLSIFEIIQRVIVVKAAQGGWTTAGENLICYYIENPADQLYISGTDELLERWGERKLDPAIDAFDLRDKIASFRTDRASKKSGDKTFRKTYANCALDLVSARSAPSLRAEDKRILFRDELDSAPKSLTTGEGNYLDVSYVRTNAWADRRKIYDISTPTTADSLIWAEFQLGDQRKFYVKCRHCGIYQPLEFGEETGEHKTRHGLKGQYEGNRLVSVYYQCAHCRDRIEEYEKERLIRTGKWTPTAESQIEYTRSYSDNTLIRPPGMLDWREIYQTWQRSKDDPERRVTFRNLYMGLPNNDEGERPVIEVQTDVTEGYSSWEVPNDVLYITLGCDVQRGQKNRTDLGPRLELEVLGIGLAYKTSSIGYKIFRGAIDNEELGAWKEFYNWIVETGFKFEREDGVKIGLSMGFVDSGDGKYKGVVYRFCEKIKRLFPSKGFRKLKKNKGEKYAKDVPGESDKLKFRAIKTTSGVLYEISTVHYKDILYNNLSIKRVNRQYQLAGYCAFPNDYPPEYYKQLTSEEREADGSYNAHGRRTEALDCRVMALCASDAYLHEVVLQARKAMKKRGWEERKTEKVINSKWVLARLESRLRVQAVRKRN